MPDSGGAASTTEARYKIGEICRLADVQPYVLRYWENEFPVLAGDRSQPGPRLYTEADLKVIQRIKTLLYVEGFTIAGAKKRLETELRNGLPEPTEDESSDTAPVPAVAPPPSPASAAPEPKRRTRTKPQSVDRTEPELPEIFEEEVSDHTAPVATQGAREPREVRTGVVTPPAPDPRLERAMERVVKELKGILALLSK